MAKINDKLETEVGLRVLLLFYMRQEKVTVSIKGYHVLALSFALPRLKPEKVYMGEQRGQGTGEDK